MTKNSGGLHNRAAVISLRNVVAKAEGGEDEGNNLLGETLLWGTSLGNEAKKPLRVWAKMEEAGTGHWNIGLEGRMKTEGEKSWR